MNGAIRRCSRSQPDGRCVWKALGAKKEDRPRQGLWIAGESADKQGSKCGVQRACAPHEIRRGEDAGWMRLSCFCALALAFAGTGGAWALNAPRTLHHSKGSEPRLTETHRGGHRAAAHGARPA